MLSFLKFLYQLSFNYNNLISTTNDKVSVADCDYSLTLLKFSLYFTLCRRILKFSCIV